MCLQIRLVKLVVELGTDRGGDYMLFYMKKIVEWCGTWSMKLSPEKCKAMHFRKQSSLEDYLITENKKVVTECEKDLRILVSSDGKCHW